MESIVNRGVNKGVNVQAGKMQWYALRNVWGFLFSYLNEVIFAQVLQQCVVQELHFPAELIDPSPTISALKTKNLFTFLQVHSQHQCTCTRVPLNITQ